MTDQLKVWPTTPAEPHNPDMRREARNIVDGATNNLRRLPDTIRYTAFNELNTSYCDVRYGVLESRVRVARSEPRCQRPSAVPALDFNSYREPHSDGFVTVE